MINYIVYGNTDYLDILTIQTDYMVGKGHLVLFLDKNNLELHDIYEKYNEVIFYDKHLTYPQRLSHCLRQIDMDYFILIHDIDILLHADQKLLKEMFNFLRENRYDRIDLKYSAEIKTNFCFKIEHNKHHESWELLTQEEIGKGEYLMFQDDVNNFIYNVNPSIWKKDPLLKLMDNFSNKTYRTIEDLDVQEYAKKLKVFKIYSPNKFDCGYYACHHFFKFLHISHGGKLLPLNDSFTSSYGQSYKDVKDDYIEMVNKYNLKSSNKWSG